MVNVSVGAICLFGRYSSIADKYIDVPPGLYDSLVEDAFVGVETFLEDKGEPITRGENPFPYLDEGIISGPNVGSVYSFNSCLLMNCFVSGNGFNFDGVYHTIISAGFFEENIQETFSILKEVAGPLYFLHWKENSNFKRDVDVPQSKGNDIERLLEFEPKLLGI